MTNSVAAFTGAAVPKLIAPPPVEPPGPGEVRCKTLMLGICGTDRDILESTSPACPVGSEFLVLGHECLARVEEVGPEVTDCEAGDLVVPAVRRPRQQDNESSGQIRRRVDMVPWGNYVERGIVAEHGFSLPAWIDRPEFLFPVSSEIKDIAVLAEPISVSEKAVREAEQIQNTRLSDEWQRQAPRVLVTGLGPIAFAAAIVCRARGWPVTMYGRDDPDSFRAGLVTSFDCDYVHEGAYTWALADVEEDGFDLILECTGNDVVMMKAAGTLASCGILVWEGSTRLPQPCQHNVAEIMRAGILRNHVYLGTVNNAPVDMGRALEHLVSQRSRYGSAIRQLVTRQVSVDESLWHYQNREPQGVKTVVVFD